MKGQISLGQCYRCRFRERDLPLGVSQHAFSDKRRARAERGLEDDVQNANLVRLAERAVEFDEKSDFTPLHFVIEVRNREGCVFGIDHSSDFVRCVDVRLCGRRIRRTRRAQLA